MKKLTMLVMSFFLFSFFIARGALAEGGNTPQQEASPDAKEVILQWKPSENITGPYPIDTTVFRYKKFVITPFTDTRKKPFEIGRNVERGSDRLVVTKDNVSRWLYDHFIQVLTAFGVAVVKNNGDVVLEADIQRFYVTESAKYQADITLNIKLKTGDGKLLWEGTIVGKSEKFGKSYFGYNYLEGLSNACIDVVCSMLKNYQIKQAMK